MSSTSVKTESFTPFFSSNSCQYGCEGLSTTACHCSSLASPAAATGIDSSSREANLFALAGHFHQHIEDAVDLQTFKLLPSVAQCDLAVSTSEFSHVIASDLDRDEKMDILCPPSLLDMYQFLNKFFDETNIPASHLPYVAAMIERILEKTLISLNALNWRSLFLTACKIVEKWTLSTSPLEDSQLEKIYPIFSADDYRSLEKTFLGELNFEFEIAPDVANTLMASILASTM